MQECRSGEDSAIGLGTRKDGISLIKRTYALLARRPGTDRLDGREASSSLAWGTGKAISRPELDLMVTI